MDQLNFIEKDVLNDNKYMRFISVAETDRDLLFSISKIFLDGKPFDLDPTYSKGNFYKEFPRPQLISDIYPFDDSVKQSDCRNLNWIKDNSLQSIMFDPPFLFRNRKSPNNDIMCHRFSYFKTFNELLSMYKDSLSEFYKKLKKGGFLVFKCQDMTDGSGPKPFFDTHCETIKMARDIGFSLRDIGILVRKNKIIRKAKVQGCLRKVHSYYLVFKKY